MENTLRRAYAFAAMAHGSQERKFTGAPYTTHLEETAQLVWEATDGQANLDVYIAAILHDVVEDTDITPKEVGREFGGCVMSLVNELTINMEEKEREGKKVYLSRYINKMSEPAFLVKLCDRLSNVMGLIDEEIPIKFVIWYVKETQYILEHLNRKLSTVQESLVGRIEKTLVYLRLNRNF